MSEQKPRVGRKNAGRKVAEKLSEVRRQPPSQKILDIVNEISEREKNKSQKIAKPSDVEL